MRTLLILIVSFYMLFFIPGMDAGAREQTERETVDQKEAAVDPALRKRAASSLYRLKRALKEDRYPSALAALNLWRSDARAAGTFDETEFRSYRRQIYQKSVDNILIWFEVCLQEDWIREADYCQKIYRLHARAIHIFDQERYDQMARRIEQRKKEIEAERKRRQRAASK